MAEMGFGEAGRPADGLKGYFDLLYGPRTHGSRRRLGLGAWLRSGLAGMPHLYPPLRRKRNIVRR